MVLVICHVEKGGAYQVAKYYASVLQCQILVSPSVTSLIKALINKPTSVIFHAPHQCAKLGWVVRMIVPHAKIWCVEHFFLPQILRSEFTSQLKRWFWLVKIRLNDILGVKIVCIDRVSAKARRRLLGKAEDIVIGNLVLCSKNVAAIKPYDWVWAAGFNDQKRWREAKELLFLLKLSRPDIKILVCSYEQPSFEDLIDFRKFRIDFSFNESKWPEKADRLFFTSLYEGFPLALAEAMAEGMGILAWCRRSCNSQLLKFYTGTRWISHNEKPQLIDFENTPISGLQKSYSLQEHRQLCVEKCIKELI